MQMPEIQIKIDTTELEKLIERQEHLNTLMQEYAAQLQTLQEYITNRLHDTINSLSGKVDLNTLEVLVKQIMKEEEERWPTMRYDGFIHTVGS